MDPEAAKQQLAKIELVLEQVCWTQQKQKRIQAANVKQCKEYDALFERIEAQIGDAHKEIEAAKRELDEARKLRRNKMEYDALSKVTILS